MDSPFLECKSVFDINSILRNEREQSLILKSKIFEYVPMHKDLCIMVGSYAISFIPMASLNCSPNSFSFLKEWVLWYFSVIDQIKTVTVLDFLQLISLHFHKLISSDSIPSLKFDSKENKRSFNVMKGTASGYLTFDNHNVLWSGTEECPLQIRVNRFFDPLLTDDLNLSGAFIVFEDMLYDLMERGKVIRSLMNLLMDK